MPRLAVVGAYVAVAGCAAGGNAQGGGGGDASVGDTGGEGATAQDSGGGETVSQDTGCGDAGLPATLDCVGSFAGCPDLYIKDDPTPATGFGGYFDPAVRKDPLSGRLWLAYSWATAHPIPGADGGASVTVVTLETHLAYSDDQGATWKYDSVLWPAYPRVDPAGSGTSGYWSSETPDFVPVETGGAVTWYGLHLRYFEPPVDGYNPDFAEWEIAISKGTTPQSLGSQPDGGAPEEQVLVASAGSGKGLPVDVVLDSLSPQLRDCAFYNNPGIWLSGGKLYMAAECMVAGNLSAGILPLFSTLPTGDIHSWKWSFVGVLADNAVAKELDAVEMGEVGFARGADGQLLALLDPGNAAMSSDVSHTNCTAFVLSSLDPPVLARDCNGKLVQRAIASASDLQSGPGACAYDPSMTTGLVLVRRASGGSDATLSATGLRP